MSALRQPTLLDRFLRRREDWQGGLALLLCCWVPLLLTSARLVSTIRQHAFAFDFHSEYWASGRYVLEGRSPFAPPTPDAVSLIHTYPAGPYPAPVAVLFAPFALIPVWAADVLFTAILVACLFSALYLLGVRDWRCYGATFLWAPIAFAVQTANLTLLFLLALAVVWRFRHHALASAIVVGAVISLKLFLWPLVVWLVATRRYAAAAWSVAVAATITLGTWAMLGFAGFRDYPRVARVFAHYYETSSYTPFAFLVELGAPTNLARAGGLALGIVTLGLVFVAARRNGSETTAFTLAVAAALLWSPIVWLHYFALLLVPLVILNPAFSPAWLLPAILWVCPGGAAPASAWKVALPLLVCSVVLVFAARGRWGRGPIGARARGGEGSPLGEAAHLPAA